MSEGRHAWMRSVARGARRSARALVVGRGNTPVEMYATAMRPADAPLIANALLQPDSRHHVAELDRARALVARRLDVPDVFTFGAGRSALRVLVDALGLRPGDEIVVPAYTCVVVPNALEHAGLRIRWVDIELDTYGPDLAAVADIVGPTTKALYLQHLFGIPNRDTVALCRLARERGLLVLEDCAHSLGARLDGRPVGSFGDGAFSSFELSKCVTTVRGGVAWSTDDVITARLEQVWRATPTPSNAEARAVMAEAAWAWSTAVSPHRAWARETTGAFWARWRQPSTTDAEIETAGMLSTTMRLHPALGPLLAAQVDRLDDVDAVRSHAAAAWQRWALARGFDVPRPAAEAQCTWLRYPILVPAEAKADVRRLALPTGFAVGRWFVSQAHPRPGVVAPDTARALRAVAECVNLPTTCVPPAPETDEHDPA